MEGDGENKVVDLEAMQQEYDKAFSEDEGAVGENQEINGGSEGTTGEGKPAPEGGDEKADDSQGKADDTKTDDQKSPVHGSIEAVEKALKDTKAYATRLQQEKADLQRLLEEERTGKATAQQVEEQRAATRQAEDDFAGLKQSIYADYPELQPLLDPLLDNTRRMSEELEALKNAKQVNDQRSKFEAEKAAWERDVKPIIIDKHPDFDNIMKSEGYWQWAQSLDDSDPKQAAIKFNAMKSPFPQHIIDAVTEFKKSAYAKDVAAIKDAEDKKKAEKLTNMQTLRGSSSGFPGRTGGAKDPNDYDAGWEEADAILKKQGVL